MENQEGKALLTAIQDLHAQELKIKKLEEEILESDDELLKTYVIENRKLEELKKQINED